VAPVATIRLLLSPSPAEAVNRFSTAKVAPKATWQDFAEAAVAWREDAASNKDNIAFFYFGGHGIQRELGDQVLLCDDFGSGIGAYLNDGVDSQRLVRGMAPSDTHKAMARRQLFLFDACRMTPPALLYDELEKVRDLWPMPKTYTDDRNCTVLYATAPGDLSYATRGRSTVFARAFLGAMHRAAFEEERGIIQAQGPGWSIRATSLAASVAHLVQLDPNPLCSQQAVKPAGAQHDLVLRKIQGSPRVKISLRVQPGSDHKRTALILSGDDQTQYRACDAPLNPYPYVSWLKAGIYRAELTANEIPGKAKGVLSRMISVTPQRDLFVFDMAAAKST
jgi:hypothetical protein